MDKSSLETNDLNTTVRSLKRTVMGLILAVLLLSFLLNIFAVTTNRSLQADFDRVKADATLNQAQLRELVQVREIASRCINDILFTYGNQNGVFETIQKYFPQAQRPPNSKPGMAATAAKGASAPTAATQPAPEVPAGQTTVNTPGPNL